MHWVLSWTPGVLCAELTTYSYPGNRSSASEWSPGGLMHVPAPAWRNTLFHEPPCTFTTQSSCWTKLPLIINAIVQLLTRVRLFATSLTAAHQASLSITNSRSPPKLMSIELVISFNHLILCRPLLLLPSIFPIIRVSSNESVLCIRRPKDWSFSFSISPSNEYSGLISFRINWFDLLAVEETLKSLLQHHSSKVSILWHSALFMVQLSHPYMITGKTTALTSSKLLCWQSNVSAF